MCEILIDKLVLSRPAHNCEYVGPTHNPPLQNTSAPHQGYTVKKAQMLHLTQGQSVAAEDSQGPGLVEPKAWRH